MNNNLFELDINAQAKRLMRLLNAIKECGSIYTGCKSICAYTCAWKTIKKVETTFNQKIITSNGVHGSSLTEFGETLLNYLTQMHESVQYLANDFYEMLEAMD